MENLTARPSICTAIAASWILVGCASYSATTIVRPDSDAGNETAGNSSKGGETSAGGTSAASGSSNIGGNGPGGTSSTAPASSSGGTGLPGGGNSTGGLPASGGTSQMASTSIGGAPGGVSGAGGTSSPATAGSGGNGSPGGGTTAVGGTTAATGGTASIGGFSPGGGTSSTSTTSANGGSPPSGGTTAVGGTKAATGGTSSIGGTNPVGGTTSGTSSSGCTSPCQNPDAAHCSVSCVEGTSSASCVVKALDADKDGYGTTACAAAPGTDCDDTNARVHPGATEICDGIDNNCNGKVDMHDGLPLSGSPLVQTGYTQINLAWSPTTQAFALVAQKFNQGTNQGLFFGQLGPAGTVNWNSSSIFGDNYNYNQHLVWVPAFGKFAFTCDYGNQGGSGTNVLMMSADGTPDANGYNLGSSTGDFGTSLALRAAGDLVVAHHDLTTTYVSRYSNQGVELRATIAGEQSILPHISTSGDLSAIIYQINSTHTINWVRLNASIVAGTPAQLTYAGQNPDITGIDATSYAMAWATASGFTYQAVNSSDGSSLCGPTQVPFGDGTLDSYDAVAVRATQYGTLVLANDYGGKKIHVFRFDKNCNVIDEESVHDVAGSATSPAIAVGGGFVAFAWSEADGYVRVLGERLCN